MKKTGMIAALALIFVMPAQAFADSSDFEDVSEDFWAGSEIGYLAEQNIISGYDNNLFKPNEPVKRSQAAAMMVEALDLEITGLKDPGFTDISTDFHAYEAAAAMNDEGIMTGNDGEFMPNESLTRGQMAAVLNRAYSFSDGEGSDYFRDMEEGDAFYQDIQAIAQADITTGFEDGTYGPNDDITRAQFSVFLARAMDAERFVNPDRTSYSNSRFGFEVTYPDVWPDGEEAANGDGKVLYDSPDSTIRAFGTHYLENQAPELSNYEEVSLHNGDEAYYKSNREDGMIEFDLVRITDDKEYHINGEVTEAFYSENGDDLRNTIYSLNTTDVSSAE